MINLISNDGCDCSNSWHFFCECSRTTQVALRGRFIQTLTEKSIANQNMKVERYDRAAKDDTGRFKKSKYIFIVFYNGPDKCIMSVWYFCSVS